MKENLLPCSKYIEECELVPELLFKQDYVRCVEMWKYLFNDNCGRLHLHLVTERRDWTLHFITLCYMT